MPNLDYNAGAPLHRKVATVMGELLLDDRLGNPSSVHARGRAARDVVEAARRAVAAALGAEALEITFTSGGTESDNLAVFGAVGALRSKHRSFGLLTSPLEHPAIRQAATALRTDGVAALDVPVDPWGRIDPDQVVWLLEGHPEIGVLALAAANHEIGNVYDLTTLVAAARRVRPNLVIHVDAVAAMGKVPLDFAASEADSMAFSAHKIGGPSGVGALVHRKSLKLEPRSRGGQQERGYRVGTENVLGIVGFGVAAPLSVAERPTWDTCVRPLQQRLIAGLLGQGARIHGDRLANTGNTVNFGFSGCDGELVCMGLDLEGFAVSMGAACSAGSLEPSPVLLALGLSRADAREGVRASLGPDNTCEEIDRLLELLPGIVARVRDAAREAS